MNQELLKETIDKSGVTKAFIFRKMGISAPAFFYKLHGERDFTLKEALQLKHILHMDQNLWDAIFDDGGYEE